MKSSFWVLCGITLLCFGNVRCSRDSSDNDDNFLDKTRDRNEARTLKQADPEWELYNDRELWHELTNELSELERMYNDPNKPAKPDARVEPGDPDETGKCGDDTCYNGKCNDVTHICDCTSGFSGSMCEEFSKDECEKKIAICDETGGTCKSVGSKENVVCECPPDTKLTENDGCKNLCADVVCYNGGCNADTGKCDCTSGFTGDMCEIFPKEECTNKLAACADTEGTCKSVDSKDNVQCECPPDKRWTENDGCKNLCADVVCYNGDCNADTGKCVCTSGFTGNMCEKFPDKECKDKIAVCANTGGTCKSVDSKDNIQCECPQGKKLTENEGCKNTCSDDKTCEGNRVCNKDNFCVCKNGYEGDECTVVTGCKDLKAKCDEIKKTCIFDANVPGLAACECDAALQYDPVANECRVSEATCNEEKPECIPTGGTCLQESDESIKCNCPGGIDYDDENGCNITADACDSKYPKCSESGGTCNVTTDGTTFKCNCKAGIIYNVTTACKVPDDMCNEKQPKCKETRGSCKVDKNTVKCECPEDFVYDKKFGCAEDKCIKKCGVPYNSKSNKMLSCVNGPFGDVDCKCKNKTLAFDSRDKTCKIEYCKKVCGTSNKVKCNGDIFDEDKIECGCKEANYDFIEEEEDNTKDCKLNYCKKVCGTDEGVSCEGDAYTSKEASDCTCDDSEYAFNGTNCRKVCSEDVKCSNGAPCTKKGESKFCVCKRGTSGDMCEVVKDCDEAGGTYEKCKDGKGTCFFNVKAGKAACNCSENQELYTAGGYCDVKCKDDSACEGNRKCNSDKFCVCKDGYEGDECEDVSGCKALKQQCDKINKECIFDEKAPGMATCKCDGALKYDRKANKCRPPCSTDGKCEGNRICNDDKFCMCKGGYEGDECDVVTGCKELKKSCSKIDTECIFDESAPKKATCKCKDGFTYDAKENKCKHKFCYPKNPCPSTANCTIDESTSVGYCQCPKNQYHHLTNNKCEEFANKCILRKTPCDENYKCVDGKCVCKYPEGEDKKCKPQLCKPNPCVTGAKCSEEDGSCHCEDGKYFNGKKCEETCVLKDYKKNCSCPADTERKNKGEECVNKKDDEKCDTSCGYGLCVKKGDKKYCKCFASFATSNGTLCILKKSFCAEGELQENSMKCKCEGKYKQADDDVTCILKTCDDDDVKKDCASKGGECKMDWKKGYDCKCPEGFVKDAKGKCTDLCSIEDTIKDCAKKGKFCYNSYSARNEITSTCGCPPTTAVDENGVCSGKAEYSYLIKNIPVLKKMYVLKSGINKVLLNAHLIASLRQTYKKALFDYGYLYDYNVQGDVVYCSVWINFKSAPDKIELEKIKVASKKFSNLCEDCNEAIVWPPSLLLSDKGLTEAVPEGLEFCKPEVKDRLCGKGASCVEDKKKGTGKCFCEEGYKLIEYSILMIGPYEVQRCDDINECAAGTHTCPGNTECRNTFGNYACICKDGFKKKEKPSDPETDKTDCVDMCTNSPCKQGTCKLKEKTFDCECKPGYGGSLCDRMDSNYKSAKQSTVVVGAVLGTILAVAAIAAIYYIIKRRKRSGSEDFMPAARMDNAEMTERRHMRGVTNKAYE